MEEINKEVVRITDEGIVIINYLVSDYCILVNLIVSNKCLMMFDSEEAFNTLNELLEPFLKDRITYELAKHIRKFIADQWAQQVEILNNMNND